MHSLIAYNHVHVALLAATYPRSVSVEPCLKTLCPRSSLWISLRTFANLKLFCTGGRSQIGLHSSPQLPWALRDTGVTTHLVMMVSGLGVKQLEIEGSSAAAHTDRSDLDLGDGESMAHTTT